MSIGKRSKKQVEAIRERIYDRDRHQCAVKGSGHDWTFPCRGDLTIQHRVGRGMGGSASFDSPESLLTMCWLHNFLIENDQEFKQIALEEGWSVRRNSQIQAKDVPVRIGSGLFLLNEFEAEAL